MEKDKGTGECLNGTYFWCSNMIVVRDLKQETIVASIQDLIEQEEFEHIFLQCSSGEEDN